MKRFEHDIEEGLALTGDALLLCGGAGVVSASLIAILSSADAFSARVLSAANQADATHALCLKSLANSLLQMQAATDLRASANKAATEIYAAGRAVTPPGAPVVT